MFPIAKDALSFREISNYWSRAINPPASSEELFHTLEAAWWLGELRGDSLHSPLQLLKKMFTLMRDRDDLGIVFIVGNSAGPLPIELPDGSVTVDLRQVIRVPSSDIKSWDEISCSGAFQALAGTCSLDSYPNFAVAFASISLSYQEFTAWLAKRGFDEPTFWRPLDHTPKKSWKVNPGKELKPHENAILSTINVLFPNGELDHKAKKRNANVNQLLENSGRSKVSPRVIQRTLAKITFS